MSADGAPSNALLRLDRFVVVVVFMALGALALASPLYVGISGMRSAGCGSACSTSLVGLGGAVIMGGSIGITVLAFLGLLVLSRTTRYLWWVPCSALAITIVVLVIGNHVIDLGVGD